MIQELLIHHEGISPTLYQCTSDKWSIGIGRNLEDNPLSDDEIMYLFTNDLNNCVNDLKKIFPDWSGICLVRQAALIDMRFNMGPGGFRSFKNMIAAIKRNNWAWAAKEAKDSQWFRKGKGRAKTVYKMLLTGDKPKFL